MARTIKGTDATNVGKRVQYTHGLLLPVQAVYYEWADKEKGPDGKMVKVEGTGGERTYEQWSRLPESKRGQKWIFEVDPRVLKPDLEFTAARGVMVGFEEWQRITLPSIMDTVGEGDQSVNIFLDRAAEGNWYTESEMAFTGFYQDKPQNTHKFIRMTQDLETLRQWNAERYPRNEEVVPTELVERASQAFRRLAKGDTDKFNTLVAGDGELSPYLLAFAKDDYAMVR